MREVTIDGIDEGTSSDEIVHALYLGFVGNSEIDGIPLKMESTRENGHVVVRSEHPLAERYLEHIRDCAGSGRLQKYVNSLGHSN